MLQDGEKPVWVWSVTGCSGFVLISASSSTNRRSLSFEVSLSCAIAFRPIASSKASSPHGVRSSASSLNFYYPLHFLRCLHLLPRLPVTPILPPIFPSITCFRRQFLSKMWPIQLAFLLFIVCRICLSFSTLCNTFSFITRSAKLIFSIPLQQYISKLSEHFLRSFRSVQVSAPYKGLLQM